MRYWLKILGVWLILKGFFLLPFFLNIKIFWPQLSFDVLWRNFDGPYFLAVTDSWYNSDVIQTFWAWLDRPAAYFPAHFPLFPLFIKVFTLLRLSLPVSGLLATLFFSFVMIWVWVRLYQVIYQKLPHPILALLVVLIPSRMWVVNNIIAPESLFIVLTMLTFLFWERKKYLPAIIHAILAFWTKSPAFFVFAALGLWLWVVEHKANLWLTIKDKRSWLVLIGGMIALVGLNGFYYLTTGNFWAYFNSGDNMHLFFPPLQVFNPQQTWVGSFWLEDVVILLSLYTLLLVRSWNKFRHKPMWIYSSLFLFSLFFVSHRDISRYALPIAPLLTLMNADLFYNNIKTWLVLGVYAVLTFFYAWNFTAFNHL